METVIQKRKQIETYCYVLKLSKGKFYVGITSDIKQRINFHATGYGSKFSRENLPLLFYCFEKRTFDNFVEVYLWESETTFRLMEVYGYQNVCGGTYQGNSEERRVKFNNRKAREMIRHEIINNLFPEKSFTSNQI